MRASLRARQTAAVTSLIALAMTVLSIQHLANLARVGLEDSRSIGELLGRMVYQRARDVIAAGGDPVVALQTDQGIRSILESTAAYGRNVTYAAVVDNDGIAIAHSFPALEGQRLEPGEDLSAVLDAGTMAQVRSIYADRSLDVALPLQLGEHPFGAIRVGLSPVLVRNDLAHAILPMLWATLLLSGAALFVGLVLARRILRPIHIINTGLSKLGRGERIGNIDLPNDEELEGVGESFKAISEKLASRSLGRLMAGVTHEVRNPLNAMAIHLELVREKLLRQQRDAHAPVGAVLRVEGGDRPATEFDGACEHLDVIGAEIKRLDEVITGFVRFIRPEELQLQPVNVEALIAEVLALIEPNLTRRGILSRTAVPTKLPRLEADPALLRQALLNLALNACQAMPKGGTLKMGATLAKDRRVALTVEDTGTGIPAADLERIFDLYFTTKPEGTGIGLSIVYRIVQLHGGEIEVESTQDRGTTFRLLLPRNE
ncbi:MAG: ATP-binding protein [Vicinamibacterales bacterium]|nr:ATP-binding protein [Vicinamibacterales bacterium]